MALSALPTLAYVRSEVLQRCGINTGGNRGARASQMVDSCIRQAVRQLGLELPWLRLQATRTIQLQANVVVYDFPDDVDAGDIEYMGVHAITSGKVLQMKPDPDHRTRNALQAVTNSQPLFYWFEQEATGQATYINIIPSPDITSYDTIIVDGYLTAGNLNADTDVLNFDGEAVMQRTEILARPRLGLDLDPNLVMQHKDYLGHLRARQGDGEGTMPGGSTSYAVRPEDSDRRWARRGWDPSWQPDLGWYGP